MDKDNRRLKHPRESAGLISKTFFCWILPIFRRGYRIPIEEEDLPGPMQSHISSQLGEKLEKAWQEQCEASDKPSLYKAIWKVFGKQILFCGIMTFLIEFVFNPIMKTVEILPRNCIELFYLTGLSTFLSVFVILFFIQRLVTPICLLKLIEYYEPNQMSMTEYDAFLYSTAIVIATLVNVVSGHHYMLGNLQLGMEVRVACSSLIYRKALKLSRGDAEVGKLVKFLSTDVSTFDSALMFVHVIWAAPLQVLAISILTFLILGVHPLWGTALFALFMALQVCFGKLLSTFKAKADIKTEARLSTMYEIISGIQVIKMYAWEKPFYELIEKNRRNELKQVRRMSWIRAMFGSFKMFLSQSALFLSMLGYTLSGHIPTAIYVFTITSFFNVVRQMTVASVPTAVTTMADAKISIKRITQFLTGEEISPRRTRAVSEFTERPRELSVESPPIVFLGVSAKWHKDQQENTLNPFDLKIQRNETVAIIGKVGSGKSSLLQVILNEVPFIDGTVYVDGMVSYAAQEPWIFPGFVRENIIFRQEFNEERYVEVCRVCALLPDFEQLPQGDATILEEKGNTLSGGQKARINLARAVYREANIYLLDDPLSAVDNVVGQYIFKECIMRFLKGKSVVLVTHNQECLSHVGGIYVINNGNVEGKRRYEQLFDLEGNLSDDILSIDAVNAEGDNQFGENTTLRNRSQSRKKTEIIRQGSIRGISYKEYARAGGGYIVCFVLMTFLFFIAHSTGAFNDYFLRFWVNMEQTKRSSTNGSYFSEALVLLGDFHETEYCLYFYSCIVFWLIVFALIRSLAFMTVCMRASQNLHKNLYSGVVGTTMSFFNVTSQGTIINRFSSDIKSVDRDLPIQFLDTLHAAFTVCFISLMVTTVNPWMIILTAVTLVIFCRIKEFCLKTIRDIKRTEDSRRSPVFAHLNATMNGLTTIRALGVQNELRDHFDDLQDMHTGPVYIGMTGKRAFGFWLEMFVVVYVALVLLSFRFFLNEQYGGNVGFAVTQAISLTGIFQYGMRQWGELETRMTSVERILEYSQQEPEEKIRKTTATSTEWPSQGEIVFNQVSVRYLKEEDLVLRELSFRIKRNEKIGIVGRTGAGKSSILAALLRLVAAEHGTIEIDGVDITGIPLSVLRSKISVIPQEPVLFSGTIRKNLDPFEEYQDNALWSALENVELRQFIWERPGGLQSSVAGGGTDLSVGQRQLICLARAIIRKNKILVLDEATANVDHATDGEIQKTIAEKFKECTVLTIAHRVETVIDSDRILVLDKGRVVEFDHPFNLLQDETGVFYRLASEAKTIFNNLLQIARQNYENRLQR